MRKTANNVQLQDDLSQEDLDRYRQSGTTAVDCEMTGLLPHRDLLCLIQICDQTSETRIIRSKTWEKTPMLKEFFTDGTIMKIFHFAIMDYAFILHHLGCEINNPYCTKIASKLARTYSEDHSLASLTKELMGVELNKSEQSTFWLADKLTQKQMTYAANDVLYLIELRTHLETILEKKGNLSSGISFQDLNLKCQASIPMLVHLWINGWEFGRQEKSSAYVFGR